MPKIWRLAEQGFQRMSGRQRVESTGEILNFGVSSFDTNPSAELLQHINAGSSVRRVHHEVHRPVPLECTPQSSEARIGVGEMMENPGTHDLIETHPQVANLLDGQLVHVEILQVVLRLELLRVANAGLAAVDGGNLGLGPPQSMLGSLRC